MFLLSFQKSSSETLRALCASRAAIRHKSEQRKYAQRSRFYNGDRPNGYLYVSGNMCVWCKSQTSSFPSLPSLPVAYAFNWRPKAGHFIDRETFWMFMPILSTIIDMHDIRYLFILSILWRTFQPVCIAVNLPHLFLRFSRGAYFASAGNRTERICSVVAHSFEISANGLRSTANAISRCKLFDFDVHSITLISKRISI